MIAFKFDIVIALHSMNELETKFIVDGYWLESGKSVEKSYRLDDLIDRNESSSNVETVVMWHVPVETADLARHAG